VHFVKKRVIGSNYSVVAELRWVDCIVKIAIFNTEELDNN